MTVPNNIIGGPSKFDLMIAFFDKNGKHRRPVRFKIKGPDFPGEIEVPVVINALTWEDGSGNNWLFEGYSSDGPFQGLNVVGFFNLNRREGWIKPA
jgi:hypothetical protein